MSSAEPGDTILPVLTAGTQLGGDSLRVHSSLEEADPEGSVLTSLERSSGGLPSAPAQAPGWGSELPHLRCIAGHLSPHHPWLSDGSLDPGVPTYLARRWIPMSQGGGGRLPPVRELPAEPASSPSSSVTPRMCLHIPRAGCRPAPDLCPWGGLLTHLPFRLPQDRLDRWGSRPRPRPDTGGRSEAASREGGAPLAARGPHGHVPGTVLSRRASSPSAHPTAQAPTPRPGQAERAAPAGGS